MFNPGLFGAKRPEIAYLMRQMRAYKKKYNKELRGGKRKHTFK